MAYFFYLRVFYLGRVCAGSARLYSVLAESALAGRARVFYLGRVRACGARTCSIFATPALVGRAPVFHIGS